MHGRSFPRVWSSRRQLTVNPTDTATRTSARADRLIRLTGLRAYASISGQWVDGRNPGFAVGAPHSVSREPPLWARWRAASERTTDTAAARLSDSARPWIRNAHGGVGCRPDAGREPVGLVPEKHGDAAGQVYLVDRSGAVGRGGQHAQAPGPKQLEDLVDADTPHHRKVEERPAEARTAFSLYTSTDGPGDDDGRGPGRVGRPKDRAGVARVPHLDEHRHHAARRDGRLGNVDEAAHGDDALRGDGGGQAAAYRSRHRGREHRRAGADSRIEAGTGGEGPGGVSSKNTS